ncbi:transcription elongation factor Elf1 like-domain-containing protein [Lipomyces oligophaga]|uniref:transcription elongation factor Elf1 like-domain-containing protein n=1 Tax=Lipomyces oligophaga TaxID=45792 RepID=UPI0034CD290D
MGKRKKSTRKPQGRRKREPLPKEFSCLFCNHEKSVSCRLDHKSKLGFLSCKICGQHFQTPINKLSVEVDVYSVWVDAVESGEIEEPTTVIEDDVEDPSDLSDRDLRHEGEDEDEDDDII